MTRKKDPRTARLPVPAGELPPFTPVPRQYVRHDGWTPERQIAFIEALADTGSVEAACKAVDMSQAGAYNLRRQPGAECFRKAWQAALGLDVALVEDVVMDRAHNSFEEPLYSYGRLIGTRRRYNDRLLMFILRNRTPERFADGKRVSGMGGLNAVGQMELERVKKQWRAEWEAEQRKVSPAEIRASIDRKIEEIRLRLEREHAAKWAMLSAETRAAWDAFSALRDRDLDTIKAHPDLRRNLTRGPFSTTPEPLPLPPPRYHKPKPEPRAPRTEWTVMDDDFGKA
jgi:hypothetical protein